MNASLQSTIQGLIEAFQQSNNIVGIAAAVVEPAPDGSPNPTYFVSGNAAIGGPAVCADTQFEIGSETKTFTAGLLAYAINAPNEGVRLSDPLQKYAPEGVRVPIWNSDAGVVEITLQNLATHQSALPDMPNNMRGGRRNYDQQLLWEAIEATQLPWAPGSNFLYSNFGFGTLGTVLANKLCGGSPTSNQPPPYNDAIKKVLTDPLGMSSTYLERITPNLATGYDEDGDPTNYWFNTNALAGGGGLISSIADMAAWASANLGYFPAVSFLSATVQPVSHYTVSCRESDADSCKRVNGWMGLGWEILMAPKWGLRTAHKNGGTRGMSSSTYLLLDEKIGVTLLCNRSKANPDRLAVEIIQAILAARSQNPG